MQNWPNVFSVFETDTIVEYFSKENVLDIAEEIQTNKSKCRLIVCKKKIDCDQYSQCGPKSKCYSTQYIL